MSVDVKFVSDSTLSENYQIENISMVLRELINQDLSLNNQLDLSDSILDNLVKVFIGNKKSRLGNYPSDECLKSIREIILRNLTLKQAIPIVVPIGPHKTIVSEDIDLAELYAIKTLAELNNRIRKLYPLGLRFYLRFEDVTGWFITGNNDGVKENIEKYLTGIENLINVMGYNNFILPFRESQLTNYDEVEALINIFIAPLTRYYNETDVDLDFEYTNLMSYRVLKALGWSGHIPHEQRKYYRERFKYHYPENNREQINTMIIKYLAISFAKAKLGALFPEEIRDYYIQLTFAPPVPGAPQEIVSRRVYYRTLPSNISRIHLPFWRAKGFLRLNKSGVNLGINNWYSGKKFYQHKVKLQRDSQSVILSADIDVIN